VPASTFGVLYVVPSTLGDSDPVDVLPKQTLATVRRLQHFVVEEPKTARAFLKRVGIERSLPDLHMQTLNEHTDKRAVASLLEPLLESNDLGLLSEAGYPAVADPGAELIALAHQRGVRVVPLVGPSSILLALVASGLNGQCFAFHGYLPVEAARRAACVRDLEARSRREQSAQIFIETPYRSKHMLEALLQTLRADTHLTVASQLTLPQEMVRTMTVSRWKEAMPDLDRKPTVFVLQSVSR
jgi:16S rRNA (cytidine1402-2'-O)-methyltransferase